MLLTNTLLVLFSDTQWLIFSLWLIYAKLICGLKHINLKLKYKLINILRLSRGIFIFLCCFLLYKILVFLCNVFLYCIIYLMTYNSTSSFRVFSSNLIFNISKTRFIFFFLNKILLYIKSFSFESTFIKLI